jgi:hypothetical protein
MDNDSEPANDNVDEDENTSQVKSITANFKFTFSMAFPTPLVTENNTMDSGPSVSLPIQGLKQAQGHPNGPSVPNSPVKKQTRAYGPEPHASPPPVFPIFTTALPHIDNGTAIDIFGDICPFPYLLSPLLLSPCLYVLPLLTSVPSPGVTPTTNDFYTDGPPGVIDFRLPSPLRPEWHCMSRRHIGTGPHDTTAPSAITWTPIYERLGDRRPGTVIPCISFVD